MLVHLASRHLAFELQSSAHYTGQMLRTRGEPALREAAARQEAYVCHVHM